MQELLDRILSCMKICQILLGLAKRSMNLNRQIFFPIEASMFKYTGRYLRFKTFREDTICDI